ncbi:MAG: hypothetical protein HQL26_06480 [Candidatus Omnitrophica bacterium]|nr:hypothetical protein [Candidatus Omnitrophota bacterium]
MFSSIVMFGATYVKPGEIVYNFKGDWILGSPFAAVLKLLISTLRLQPLIKESHDLHA